MVRSAICGDKGRDGLVRARANPPLSDSQHSVPLFCAIHVAAAVVLATMIGMKVPARDKCIAKLGNKKNEVIGPPAVSTILLAERIGLQSSWLALIKIPYHC